MQLKLKYLLLIFIPVLLSAQGGFQSLQVPTTARELGIGIPGVTLFGSVNSLFSNPAALSLPDNNGWNFSYFRYPAQIDFSSGAFATTLSEKINAGLGMRYFSYGDFRRIDAFGVENGTFTASEFAGTLAASLRVLNRLSLGINATYVYTKIDAYYLSAISGVLSLAYYEKASTLSIVYSTILPYYISEDEEFPGIQWLGVSKHLAHLPLWIHVMGSFHSDGSKSLNMGGEFNFKSALYLTWGFSTQRFDLQTTFLNQDLIAGTSAGIGFYVGELRIDFALRSLGGAGTITALTIGNEIW